ncbi:MAG TPA: hypothetical protein VM165_12320 [Planctomycetaceae bacterium]|nr:hypothetical protein [Planctomycetaceae bacterium]
MMIHRANDRRRRRTDIGLTVAVLLAAWSAAAPAQSSPDALADLRLMTMKTAAKEYVFRSGPGPKETFAVSPEPLLRFTNPVSGLQAGGFFVWSDVSGRPMAAAQVFLTAENLWLHEFQSLSPHMFTAARDGKSAWEPQKPGVTVRAVPNAPSPAESAVKRLVQMRDIAKRFAASDEFEGRPRSDELRLLTKPLVRFGGDQMDTLDGALFTLAYGTDPELLILLEALRTDGEYRWHYSLAPMTGYALKATLDDQPVWEVGWRKPPFSPREPFFLLVHSREAPTSK